MVTNRTRSSYAWWTYKEVLMFLAKFEIYQLMIDLTKKIKGIIMISSEMPELLGVTDRILVMSNGRVAGIVKTSETNQRRNNGIIS